jgi:hypothetical protein
LWSGRDSYADDTQVFQPLTQRQQFSKFICIGQIESWMGSSQLKLNADKTQVIWVGTQQQLDKLEISEALLQSAKSTLLT